MVEISAHDRANVASNLSSFFLTLEDDESTLGSELRTTRWEVQRFVSETNAQRHLSANEMNTMREEYVRSKNVFSEVTSFLLATREELIAVEKQVAAWKDECHPQGA